jgi:DNA-binding MarR family transcriptional regulator
MPPAHREDGRTSTERDVSDFGLRLPYLIRRVNAALSQRLDRTLKAFELTQGQLSALALLGRFAPRGMSNSELSQLSGLTPQSMSTAVAGLVQRDLVNRTPHSTHGRIVELHITAGGSRLLKRVQLETAGREGRDLGGLTPDQQDQLREFLRAMMRNLDLYLPE